MNTSVFHSKQILCLVIASVLALIPPVSPTHAQNAPSLTIDSTELEKFFDPIFAEQMQKSQIPGAVVVVVKDGKILFTKGYGYANLEKKTYVVPDKTIFRIGSISKVFTAIAVMQLADHNLIKMSDNVNKYLTYFKIPDTYPQPVTFANLLTHSAGFDEISPGRMTTSADKVVPLDEFIKPRLIRRSPPGEISSYETYSISLAAHLVENVSGTPFKEYLDKNIFKQLGMERTSITSVPADQQSDLATGYEYSKEAGYRPLEFVWFNTYPASDINSTATDMARFMIALLEGGRYGENRIVSERTSREMLRQQHTNHPRLPGWSYGLQESRKLNNQRGIEHGGSMDDGYSSFMYLLPDHHLGIFTACTRETTGLHDVVKERFVNRFFQLQSKPVIAEPGAKLRDGLNRFTGEYRWAVYCHTCRGSNVFIPQPFKITANADGSLSFWGGRWLQAEPLLFQLADGALAGQVYVAFRENKDGQITHLFLGGPWTYEKTVR